MKKRHVCSRALSRAGFLGKSLRRIRRCSIRPFGALNVLDEDSSAECRWLTFVLSLLGLFCTWWESCKMSARRIELEFRSGCRHNASSVVINCRSNATWSDSKFHSSAVLRDLQLQGKNRHRFRVRKPSLVRHCRSSLDKLVQDTSVETWVLRPWLELWQLAFRSYLVSSRDLENQESPCTLPGGEQTSKSCWQVIIQSGGRGPERWRSKVQLCGFSFYSVASKWI